MTDYYVAATGSDTNVGTLALPWKTANRVNTGCSNGSLGLKDKVLFKRGDTFYGKLRTPGAYGLGGVAALDPNAVGWLKIGAYGDDPNLPILSGYKILNTATGWVQHDANTWKLDYSVANGGVTYTGCSVASEYTDVDVGFLKVDGVIKAVKRATLAELVNQWDFHSVGTVLYVRSTAKPTTLAADIRCSVDLDGIYMTAGVEIVDLAVEGYGADAVFAPRATIGGGRGRMIGCELRELGGSYIDDQGTLRYGNGVTVWGNAKDLHFERNIVHDVYDAAFSVQGSGTTPFTNVMWRRNLTYRCCQAEEYAYFSGTGPGFVNVKSEYNTNLFAGYGFGADTRSDNQARDGLQSYQWGDAGSNYTADISSRRNVYYDCGYAYSLHARPPLGLKSDFNFIMLRAGTLIQQGLTYTIENPAPWLAYSGREQHSKFVPLAASTKTDITDADVRAGYDALEEYVSHVSGQSAGGNAVLPIHKPWAA